MLCRVVVFDVPTSGGSSSTTVTTDAQGRTLPSKPARAAIVAGTAASHSVDPGGSPTGLGTDGAAGSIGFVCVKAGGTEQRCVSFLSQDNVSTSNTKRVHVNGQAAYIPDPTLGGGGGMYGESVDVVLLTDGTVRFSMLGLTGRGGRVVCQVFYGDDQFSPGDIKVDCGIASTPDDTTIIAEGVPTRYQPPGGENVYFKPTHVFLLTGNDAAWESGFDLPFDSDFSDWEDNLSYSMGFAQRDQGGDLRDSVITQRSFIWSDKDNLSTTASAVFLNTTNTMMRSIDPSSGALTGGCKVSGFSNTGFEVQLTQGIAAYEFAYLALDLGHTSSEIFTYNTQAGTGNTNLQIPTEGGDSDAGQRLNPDGVVLLQTQINYGSEDAAQTDAKSAAAGIGLAARHVDEVEFTYAVNATNFYTTAVGLHPQYAIVANTDIFADYVFSTGDYVLITSTDSSVTAGRYEIASKYSNSIIALTANASSNTGPVYDVSGALYVCGFGLTVAQRASTWQVKDNSSTSDTQSATWDELGYLVKKHGAATYPTNTVTRFWWKDHGSASVATSEDAVFYYESSQVNNRSWPMLAFEFRRQRVTLASVVVEVTATIERYILNTNQVIFARSAEAVATVPDPKSQLNHSVYPSPAEVGTAANTPAFEADWEPTVTSTVVPCTVPVPTGAWPQSRSAAAVTVPCVSGPLAINLTIPIAVIGFIVQAPSPSRWSHQAGFLEMSASHPAVPSSLGLTKAVQVVSRARAGSLISGATTMQN